MCKISYKAIFYNTGNIANINNYKWSITFKNCESCCTPVTYHIVHQLYFNKEKKEKRKEWDTKGQDPAAGCHHSLPDRMGGPEMGS